MTRRYPRRVRPTTRGAAMLSAGPRFITQIFNRCHQNIGIWRNTYVLINSLKYVHLLVCKKLLLFTIEKVKSKTLLHSQAL